MLVKFDKIFIGEKYSRPKLSKIWGYKGYQAIARGVVTPKDTNFIILFVTAEQQSFQEQYNDELEGDILKWEGPTDHFAEDRLVSSNQSNDEIHIFYRTIHHSDFTYLGEATLLTHKLSTNKPIKITFKIQVITGV